MYKLLKLNGQYENAINEYIADEFNDLAQIEAPIYSLAYVVEDQKEQILNAQGEWVVYINGEGGGSGGSSLPDITAEDEGKVLAVDEGEAVWADAPSGLPEIGTNDEGKMLTVVGEAETTELFPEQELTIENISYPVTVQNADLSLFVDGTTARCTVDGTSYEATIDSGNAQFVNEHGNTIYALNEAEDDLWFSSGFTGTYTVSAVVLGEEKNYSAQWVEAQGAGKVIEISPAFSQELMTALQTAIATAIQGGGTAYRTDSIKALTEADGAAFRDAYESLSKGVIPVLSAFGSLLSVLSCYHHTDGDDSYGITFIVPFFSTIVGVSTYSFRISADIVVEPTNLGGTYWLYIESFTK